MITAVSGVAIPSVPAQAAPSSIAQDKNAFAEVFQTLSDTLRSGENAAIAGVKGEMPMQQVVEKVLETERTLTTAISIRDKIVSAYLEMTRMQI